MRTPLCSQNRPNRPSVGPIGPIGPVLERVYASRCWTQHTLFGVDAHNVDVIRHSDDYFLPSDQQRQALLPSSQSLTYLTASARLHHEPISTEDIHALIQRHHGRSRHGRRQTAARNRQWQGNIHHAIRAARCLATAGEPLRTPTGRSGLADRTRGCADAQ